MKLLYYDMNKNVILSRLSPLISYLPRRITNKRLVIVKNHKSPRVKTLLKTSETHQIRIHNLTIFNSNSKLLHTNRHNILSNYLCWVERIQNKTMEENEVVSTSIFDPPLTTKGMKRLDKSAFKKTCKLPGLKVPTQSVSGIGKLFKSKLVKIPHLKPIASLDDNDPQKLTHKMFLFDPQKLSSVDNFTEDQKKTLKSHEIVVDILEWFHVELGYANWTTAEITRAILPNDIEENVTGFTTIGHIAHFNLKDAVLDYKYILGEVILDRYERIRTVVNKMNTIDNTYRNFQMELLAGEEDYLTTVKENGCLFQFDFSKVYWNSRLVSEHRRLIEKLNHRDILYDVFAGVGPFAILAAKKGVTVLANDLNPDSFKALNKNIALNKIKTEMKTYNLDGREFLNTAVKEDLIKRLLAQLLEGQGIHIVMNLPALALEFLDTFKSYFGNCEKLKGISRETIEVNLPIVHCYCFSKSEDVEMDVRERAEAILCCSLPTDHVVKFVRNVAPNKEMMCLTFKLMPNLIFSEIPEEPDIKRQKLSE